MCSDSILRSQVTQPSNSMSMSFRADLTLLVHSKLRLAQVFSLWKSSIEKIFIILLIRSSVRVPLTEKSPKKHISKRFKWVLKCCNSRPSASRALRSQIRAQLTSIRQRICVFNFQLFFLLHHPRAKERERMWESQNVRECEDGEKNLLRYRGEDFITSDALNRSSCSVDNDSVLSRLCPCHRGARSRQRAVFTSRKKQRRREEKKNSTHSLADDHSRFALYAAALAGNKRERILLTDSQYDPIWECRGRYRAKSFSRFQELSDFISPSWLI